jgi:hypothetical protein
MYNLLGTKDSFIIYFQHVWIAKYSEMPELMGIGKSPMLAFLNLDSLIKQRQELWKNEEAKIS